MTLEDRHKKTAQQIIQQIYDNGDIYKGMYKGPYCVDCETYYTEKDLINDQCPVHKKPVEHVEEESYFFRLSKYQTQIKEHITKNLTCIFPDGKRKEILNRLKQPLKDLSISRKEVTWGIPLPFDPKFTEFVWIEALCNYLTTIQYPKKGYQDFWPGTHIIGPDVVWHHTVIWFSLLLSLGLSLPRVIAHGFINLEGQKLSKSTGVTIDPLLLAQTYGADALRYYLIREIPFGEDGDFSETALKNRLNNELANDLGNLVSRTLTLVEKYFDGKVPKGKNEISFSLNTIEDSMEHYRLNDALAEIWKYVNMINKYINDKKPWEAKEKDTILYTALDSLRIATILLSPFIPETADKINKQLGITTGILKEAQPNMLKAGTKIKKEGILFPKIP
jgi:methionyl-tRNA synthetase